jgi:hypothetical protein
MLYNRVYILSYPLIRNSSHIIPVPSFLFRFFFSFHPTHLPSFLLNNLFLLFLFPSSLSLPYIYHKTVPFLATPLMSYSISVSGLNHILLKGPSDKKWRKSAIGGWRKNPPPTVCEPLSCTSPEGNWTIFSMALICHANIAENNKPIISKATVNIQIWIRFLTQLPTGRL